MLGMLLLNLLVFFVCLFGFVCLVCLFDVPRIVAMSLRKDLPNGLPFPIVGVVHPVVHPNVVLRKFRKDRQVARWKLKKCGSKIGGRNQKKNYENGRHRHQPKQETSKRTEKKLLLKKKILFL